MSCEDAIEEVLGGANDATVPRLEELVHAEKTAVGLSEPRRKGFRPPSTRTLDVRLSSVQPGTDVARLEIKAYRGAKGVFVELRTGGQELRALHTHAGHRNPGGRLVDGVHKHFPTEKHPLTSDQSSWAYPLDEDGAMDLDTALAIFCEEINTSIIEYQPTFAG